MKMRALDEQRSTGKGCPEIRQQTLGVSDQSGSVPVYDIENQQDGAVDEQQVSVSIVLLGFAVLAAAIVMILHFWT
jgi:hypothetical protein